MICKIQCPFVLMDQRTAQEAYEVQCKSLFDALDKLEAMLDGQRYLIPYYPGGRAAPCPTLADYRLFNTLIRFDIVYYALFKANVRHIRDYPNLQVMQPAAVCLCLRITYSRYCCVDKMHFYVLFDQQKQQRQQMQTRLQTENLLLEWLLSCHVTQCMGTSFIGLHCR